MAQVLQGLEEPQLVAFLQYYSMAEDSPQSRFEATTLAMEHYNGTESSFDIFLSGWSDEDRLAFLEQWVPYSIEKDDKEMERQQAIPPLDRQGYIAAASKLDFIRGAQNESLFNFHVATQYCDEEPYPAPFVLGSHSGYYYRLRSQTQDFDITNELAPEVQSYDDLLQVESTKSHTQSPVQYIFPLGILEAVSKATFNEGGRGVETPFRVCMNPVDKSIWLVMVSYLIDGLGERDPIPESCNTWKFLRVRDIAAEPFDVMKILSWEQFTEVDEANAAERELFGQHVLATAKRVYPELHTAPMKGVKKALNIG
ncbi:MAG: hypothetical protein Q9213_002397 [Squamulea squamosa]